MFSTAWNLIRSYSPHDGVRGLLTIAVVLAIGLCLNGCAPKSRISSDPFRRTAPPSADPDDPRYNSGNTFDRANDAARQKDVSSDVSTSPATGPRVASTDRGDSFLQASQNKSSGTAPDPFLNSAAQGGPSVASPPLDRGDHSRGGGFVGTQFDQYESIRKRLDKAGAHNFHFDRDPATGESVFTCELPYPDNASLFRVFEAKSAEELKAMQAVTEQVEKWVAERNR